MCILCLNFMRITQKLIYLITYLCLGNFLNFIEKDKIEILVIFRLYSTSFKTFHLAKYFDLPK